MKKKNRRYYFFRAGVGLFLVGLAITCSMVWPHVAAFLGIGSTGFVFANAVVGFTEEQENKLKELFDAAGTKHKEAIKTEVADAIKGLVKADDFAAKLKDLGVDKAAIEKLTEAVEKQGLELQKFLEGKKEAEADLDKVIDAQKDNIKKLATGDLRQVKLTVANKTLVTRAGVSNSTQAMRLPEIGQLGYLGTVMSGLFRHAPVSPDSNGVIRYIDQQAITRAADTEDEGDEAAESEITWIERTLDLKKIMDSIPVSHESFKDVLFIRSEIERLLNVNVSLKEDQQLFAGSGAGTQLKGVYTSAGAIDIDTVLAGSLANTVEAANVYDLIAAVRVAIMSSQQSKYSPNFVLMNPVDIFKYKVLKGTDGHYLMPPFVAADGKVVDSMPIIESSQVTANTLVVGDSKFGTIYDLEAVEIEMGYVDDQFTKDTMTIKARKREALLIRTVDETGFKKVTDIAAEIAKLETP